MTPYAFILAALLIAVITGFLSKKSILNKAPYVFAALLMIACAGFRADGVSADYDVYKVYFAESPDTVGIGFIAQWSNGLPYVEPGYVYLNSLFKAIGLPFQALIFLMAFLSVTLFATFLWRDTLFSAIALLVYFSHAYLRREMVQIRAGLACAIVLWAFHFWAKDRKWRGTVLFLLAFITHVAVASAIIPLLLFHFKVRMKTKYVLISLAIAIVIGYRLSSDAPVFGLIDRVAQYQDTVEATSIGIFSNPTTIKSLVVLACSCWLFNSRREKHLSPLFELCTLSYWVSTLWIIAFNQFRALGARGASFLSIAEPLIVAQIVAVFFEDRKLRSYRHLVSFATVCLSSIMLFLDWRALTKGETLHDYKTIFQESSIAPQFDGDSRSKNLSTVELVPCAIIPIADTERANA